ncbi:MAG: polysaccharide pyruvyl transferase family protein [Methyloprofundus sp.]|nr:polysaccharide pyruvyl transferase family protein [Methyloprofundus sp.]
MIVEIRRAIFGNKGAELMLHSVIEKIKERFPDAEFAIELNRRKGYSNKIESLGCYKKVPDWNKRLSWAILYLLPRPFLKKLGYVFLDDIDVVLDAAGFAYSDQWGNGPMDELANLTKRCKKTNKKFILLPQAFGPFNDKRNKRSLIEAVQNSDLIFARDQVSYDYIVHEVGKSPNLFIAPDFTNLLKGIVPDYFDKAIHQVCLIPNDRMLDKMPAEKRSMYLPLMVSIAKYLKSKEKNPFLLIHGGKADYELAKKISDAVEGIPIVLEVDPLKIKGLISVCHSVIGSRFHGLVSALSQHVPSLATGWSHKYEMLFEDYHMEDFLLDLNTTENQLHEKIDLLINEESRARIILELSQASELLKSESEKMWVKILDVIDSK